MIRNTLQVTFFSSLFVCCPPAAGWLSAGESAGPVKLIFDTDLGNDVDDALALGAEKARKVADEVLGRVREKLGY
jgi:hypothetical protein